MDMDLNANDNFYDEIASLIPPIPTPGDYSLDDLDEILRATDSHLDSSIDLNALVPHNVQQRDFGMPLFQNEPPTNVNSLDNMTRQQNEFNFSFSAFPSPANTNESSAFSPPYDVQHRDSGLSSSSASSMHDESSLFNTDEFINFLNDDDIKMDQFNGNHLLDVHPHRNTPSPTGSCSSSGGSSTSGVHSDSSSAQHDVEMGFAGNQHSSESSEVIDMMPMETADLNVPKTQTVLKVEPELPESNNKQINNCFVAPVNMKPLKTVPTSPSTTANVIKAPTALKLEGKPIKLVNSANKGTSSPPTNSKPKTIFLSSNDFKTLMQKMNSNGSKTSAPKINGSTVNSAAAASAQIPKILVKTANGKVIPGNKIVGSNVVNKSATVLPTVSNSSGASAAQPVTKIIKTATGPMIIKQHQSPSSIKFTSSNVAAAAAARRASLGSNNSTPPDHNFYKGIMDEKMYKKQQRMIKNRESASLSRKKKKEYVATLEHRINNLEKENYTLKGENTSLRSQLLAYAQTCQCKHGNISEFILNSLNVNPKTGTEHVKIAPKPANKSLKQRMSTTTMKKNVAVLFAMAFMVTLNVGNFQNYFEKNTMENSLETLTAEEPLSTAVGSSGVGSTADAAQGTGRHLLWVDTEDEYKEKNNRRMKREVKMEVPPLHFLRPMANHRNGSSAAGETPPDGETFNSQCKDGTFSNQTENMRLASNLRKWIGGNDYLNLSMIEKPLNSRTYDNDNDIASPPVRFKLTPDYFELKSIDLPLQGPIPNGKPQKRKLFMPNDHAYATTDEEDEPEDSTKIGKNSLNLYKPKISEEYLRLFKGIKRQDDTFYVLSFNMEHILLPASVYNKSTRPKMSLMLPAGDPSLNGDIVLMQIDCEVINTTEFKLKSEMIPEKLRPLKFKTASPRPNDVANNDTNKPMSSRHLEKPLLKPEDIKVKHEPPRTFVMMGPKTQAQAEAAARKPVTFVKLNASETAQLVKNSSLFSKMQKTVEVEAKRSKEEIE